MTKLFSCLKYSDTPNPSFSSAPSDFDLLENDIQPVEKPQQTGRDGLNSFSLSLELSSDFLE